MRRAAALAERSRGSVRRARWALGMIVLLWTALVLSGLGLLWLYESTPGPAVHPPSRWPADSILERSDKAPTLVLFAHPGCPCTLSSMSLLSGVLPRFDGRVRTVVAVNRPSESQEGWEGPGWRSALGRLTQASVVYDVDGAEARRFGIVTSGHVVLYGLDGRLRFSGGISAGRSHRDDNPGLEALERALDEEGPRPEELVARAPVFGCALCRCDDAQGGKP